MSLFHRPIRPPAIWSDEAVERYLAAIREEISLDPLFRRRLRGTVVNRFVAEREGAIGAGTGAAVARRMGALGRSVLYASVALAVSVTGTMAASQGSVPGDAMYPLKRQIETLRFDALPARFHDELAAHALGQRIDELGRLAERGDWVRVAEHAAAVSHDADEFMDLVDLGSPSADRYLVVLNGLIDRLPTRAQLAIDRVVSDVDSAGARTGSGGSVTRGGSPSNGQNPGGSPGSPGANEPTSTIDVEPTPRPSPRAEPRPTAKPDATPKPEPTPRSSKKSQPSSAPTEELSAESSD